MGTRVMQRNADRQAGVPRSRPVSASDCPTTACTDAAQPRLHPAPPKPRRWQALYSSLMKKASRAYSPWYDSATIRLYKYVLDMR